ncbi:MAG: hypothetical protein HYV26_11865 [Candidatus Hydrogenedentes bacterium]|nr:hypothetical protein [Candidatus Hydrogenedentota bacterium]
MMMLWPEYCTDWAIYSCPSDPAAGQQPLANLGASVALKTSYDKGGLLRRVGTGWGGTPYPVANKTPLPNNDACEAEPFNCYAYGADWSYSYWAVLINPEWVELPADANAVFSFLHSGFPNGGGCLKNADNDFTMTSAISTGVTPEFKHLREGIERFLITDINNAAASSRAQSGVAVMWDVIRNKGGLNSGIAPNDFSHAPGGSNILFMDGHVEWSKYPSEDGGATYPTSRALLASGFQYAG